MFVRQDCLEPAEGSAHFDDLTVQRSPPQKQDELLLGEDCEPTGDASTLRIKMSAVRRPFGDPMLLSSLERERRPEN